MTENTTVIDREAAAPESTQGDRERFLKLPRHLVPTLARPLDVQLVDEWIVGSTIASFVADFQASPSLTTLARLTGRDVRTVKTIIERLAKKQWVGRAKVRNEYEPGRFGLKWRFWLTESSPFRDFAGKRSREPWVPVPVRVVQNGSPLLVGMYLAVAEQQRLDGAVTTTPSELAAVLMCSPRTVARGLVKIGCTPIVTPRSGHCVYVLENGWTVNARRGGCLVRVRLFGKEFFGMVSTEKQREALMLRVHEVERIIKRSCIRHDLVQLVDELASVDVELQAALRAIEDRYRTQLVLDPGYRRRIWGRFAARLKHYSMTRAVRAARADRAQYHAERDEALQALAAQCPECSGMKLVELPSGAWDSCTSCT